MIKFNPVYTIATCDKLKITKVQMQDRLVKGSEKPYEGSMLYIAEEKGIEPIVISEMSRSVSWIGTS